MIITHAYENVWCVLFVQETDCRMPKVESKIVSRHDAQTFSVCAKTTLFRSMATNVVLIVLLSASDKASDAFISRSLIASS